MSIIALIKAITAAVRAIEELMPESGKGSEKLAAIRAMLEGAVDGLEQKWPAIEKIIGAVVSLYNAIGVFKK